MEKKRNNFIYEPIDLCACYEPICEPPQDFLDACRKRWADYYAELEKAKPSVPTFYGQDEDGVLYFYHGNIRIRVSEHFAEDGKPIGTLIEDIIRYSANQKLGISQAG